MGKNTTITCFILFSFLAAGFSVQAKNVEVSAQLNSAQTLVGQPVQLQIQVSGTDAAQTPDTIAVDGLDIRKSGQSVQVQIINFKASKTITYLYTVFPKRSGEFEIPSLKIRAGQEEFVTAPLPLRVLGSGQNTPPSARGQAGSQPYQPTAPAGRGENEIAFAEVRIPEKPVFVGQLVPVELSFYFDARFAVEVQERPSFSGDGFTVQPISDPRQGEVEIDGVPYNVLTYQTAITPVKSGRMQIPSTTLRSLVRVPGRAPSGFDGFFDDFFGPNGFGGMMTQRRELPVVSTPVDLEVRPLPKEGKPASFAGAIGEFELSVEATPLEVKNGDPVSLRAQLSGKGNFDSITAPQLLDTEGWRLYPPKDQFVPSDAFNSEGVKEFEFMMLPRENLQQTPRVEFSFFNPETQKYVTLSQGPIAVQAEAGSAPVSQASAVSTQPTPGGAEPSSPEPTPAQGVINDSAGGVQGFVPLIQRREFLIANAAAGFAWVCLLLYFFGQSAWAQEYFSANRSKKSLRQTLSQLESSSLMAAEFYDKSHALIERILSANPGILTNLPADLAEKIQNLRHRGEGVRYGGQAGVALGASDKLEAIQTLKEFLNHVR